MGLLSIHLKVRNIVIDTITHVHIYLLPMVALGVILVSASAREQLDSSEQLLESSIS